MNAILFDTLKLTRRLKEAGFNEKQAEGAAEALGEALTGTVATKGDIDALEAKMNTRFAEISSKIDSKFSEAVRWMFGAIVVNAGVMVGLLKLVK